LASTVEDGAGIPEAIAVAVVSGVEVGAEVDVAIGSIGRVGATEGIRVVLGVDFPPTSCSNSFGVVAHEENRKQRTITRGSNRLTAKLSSPQSRIM